MQAKVPYEYLEYFFGQTNDFPRPHVIIQMVDDTYNKIITRLQKTYRQRYQDEIKEYSKLSWWEKRRIDKPTLQSVGNNYEDSFDYFYNNSQEFRDYEKRLKHLQVLIDVLKAASISKNQVLVNNFELRALESVYRNVDNYIFLQDDITEYLEKFN